MSNPRNQNKILYLPGDYAFCYYYRGFLPGVYSSQMVMKDFVATSKYPMAEEITSRAQEADIVVLQRPNNWRMLKLVELLKKEGKKIIFENDDTYKIGKGIILERLENEQQRKIAKDFAFYTEQILKLSDGAIASTEILAEEYREFNPNVAVLKNCIDPLDEFPCKPNTTGKFRIGFIASVTTNDDYLHIKDAIRKLDDRDDITIVVLGVKYQNGKVISFMQQDHDFWKSLKNVEWHPYVPVTSFMMTLADLSLDLAVIPRADNYFNRCKSNLKFLEMSLLKIPVIAQGFADGQSPYQGADEEYMTVVIHNDTWYEKILEIKLKYDEYASLASKAHDYVLENYNIETYAQTWTDTINKLINK